MKAAVLHQFGQTPRCEDYPEPVPGEGEIILPVKAAALENIDRALVRGDHYAAHQMIPSLPAVLGFDGIGALEDGRLVGFGGVRPPYGAFAERVAVKAQYTIPLPEGVDAPAAAAAPSSTMTALLGLQSAGGLQPGGTVLVNGATGFAGRLAVQVARLLGAGRVIGSGRDPSALAELPGLGAEGVVDLSRPDEAVVEAFSAAKGEGYDVILDFLWGRPTELLLRSLTPRELSLARKRARLVHAGEAAGPAISLPGEALRTSGVEIGGAGNIPPEAIGEATARMWAWLQSGALRFEVEVVPLAEFERAWQRTNLHGKRLVIVP